MARLPAYLVPEDVGALLLGLDLLLSLGQGRLQLVDPLHSALLHGLRRGRGIDRRMDQRRGRWTIELKGQGGQQR
jgi:hypothetical protein